ncbi:von Willebrand factor type A domain protein [Roseovarius albus]|uniref:von Willebrand factor type A domain protein n=1 Tax=Roseovarius albus TaxID=1247867 RepID=A0A1X6YIS9_9RHOB|nr:VWA domain-containing protein [Roseovarius albus]SLN22912.1 von Willebrand factor type A domain protein [Roseovarius albus]
MTPFKRTAFALACSSALSSWAVASSADENVMVVFDGSNSMWGQIDGTAKIEIARSVMDKLLGEWANDRQVGLMAYGHRRRGDCTDIETLVEPGAGARGNILDRINNITPTGKTPLTEAVEQAAVALSYTDEPATVVLISDGLESCERDPCALAEALEKRGVDFTAHVVGFGLGGDEDTASLSCIAEKTGGEFLSARNASELETALSTVSTAVAAAAPEPEPEPVPEPELAKVTISGPDSAIIGSEFKVSWAPLLNDGDYITIVPVGTDEGVYGNYLRVAKKSEGNLRAPADFGLYELRYVDGKSKTTLGSAPIEVVDANVTVSAPETVVRGATFEASWTGAVDKGDYITIVPVGADEGTYGNYITVRDKSKNTLKAAADPGLYEVRYVLREGAKTLASTPVEVTEAQVTVAAPETVLTGQSFEVSWTNAVDKGDYVTIVPVGADEGTYGNYQTVNDKDKKNLKAPADPGMYEVRYVLREGAKTMASTPVEVALAEVTVSAPASVVTGAPFEVSYTGTVDKGDYVTIVPMGAEEGTYGNYQTVSNAAKRELKAPADPGMYEIRYVLREGAKTMASQAIEVTEPEITISGPATALAGADTRFSWTGAVANNDYINIVPMGADDGQFGTYVTVNKRSEHDIMVPGDPGMYEVRYVLREGAKTMASHAFEVTLPEVTIDAPDQIRLGDTLRVKWSGAVNKRDYINLVPIGTDDSTYVDYFSVRSQSEHDMSVPSATGLYELRYMLNANNRVITRHTVEVLPAEAALETGASLTAPENAAAGSTIDVSWTVESDSADQRITLAKAEQAIFTWISAIKIADGTSVQIQMPDASGVYELRFLDVSNQDILARQVIKVE